VQTQRYSSDGYTSKTGDLPAYTWYDGRITAGPAVQRRIAGRNGVGGLTRVFAEISLDNTDGALDPDAQLRPRRPGGDHPARAADRCALGIRHVFKGVVDKVTIALNRVTFSLSDGVSRLAVRVNPTPTPAPARSRAAPT
jgi:hypothetical protein